MNNIRNEARIAPSAAQAVASNNLYILEMPKYSREIAVTEIIYKSRNSSIAKTVSYLDKNGDVVWDGALLDAADIPLIGEVRSIYPEV